MTAGQFQISSLALVGRAGSKLSTEVIRAILESGTRPAVVVLLPSEWKDKSAATDAGRDSDTTDASAVTDLRAALTKSGVHTVTPAATNAVVNAIRDSSADAVLLTDDSIDPRELADSSPARVLRVLPAPLPQYRGREALIWALYHDEPLWVSVCLADGSEHTGPILGRRPVEVRAGDGLDQILEQARVSCATLAAEIVIAARASGCQCRRQREWEGRTFAEPPPADIRAEVARRLAAREYSHYV